MDEPGRRLNGGPILPDDRSLKEGARPTWARYDPDEFRAWIAANKPLRKTDKLQTMAAAVNAYVSDGLYLKLGGFGQVRTSMAAIYEIIRQKKRGLAVAGHTTSHDVDVLLAGGCVVKIEVAYSFGHEFRPMRSAVGPRLLRQGKLAVSEWTNASFAWRLKAAALGLSFIPARFMMGTDTFAYSGAKEIVCPFTRRTYAALPALYPDVALIHVQRADRFGNCEIQGMVISDDDAARASRRVIVSAEEIVPEEYFLENPGRNTIPYYYVDAVVEAPFGSYPCEMPGRYWFDEHFIAGYLRASRDEEQTAAHIARYYFATRDWAHHLEIAAGRDRLETLGRIARNEEPPPLTRDVWKDE
jgi:acyl CoA:acetate/3-ketoacid CoA transferase alpha subunit